MNTVYIDGPVVIHYIHLKYKITQYKTYTRTFNDTYLL